MANTEDTRNKVMNLANRITITRIILTPLFIAAVVYGRMNIALILFAVAVISDGLDGFVARSMHQQTYIGTILDPVADKILLISAFICLTLIKSVPEGLRLPPYVPIIVISRDAIIVLGSILIHVIKGGVKIAPSFWGKFTTFFQMITIVSILIQFKYSSYIWNTTAILTVISGIDYMLKGSQTLNDNNINNRRKA
ncbi:MAG: CDP-alcohol phosphatidyltransferase family protein [Candidatus Omnitrophica bacterium]|nr:CDP-alcohol phosphatidyltransferase family protein [Candidatus Omnitrophota bacterium]